MAAIRKEKNEWIPQVIHSKQHEQVFKETAQQRFLDPHYAPDFDAARFLPHENQAESYAEQLVDLALTKQESKYGKVSLFIKANDQVINLRLADILWVEAYGDYVNFNTEKAKYLVHATMKTIESRLPKGYFVRVHRSFIIQVDKIDLIEESLVQIGKKLIPIGESYRQSFLTGLNIL